MPAGVDDQVLAGGRRDTRLCKDLYGLGENKQNFYIFDFCQNLEFFAQNQDFAEGATSEPLSARLFKARLDVIAEQDKKLKQAEQIDDGEFKTAIP